MSLHREYISNEEGELLVRTWHEGTTPQFRVDIVCESRGVRKPVGEYATRSEADGIADWFGREGNLRAEIIPLEN